MKNLPGCIISRGGSAIENALTVHELADLLDPPVSATQVWHLICYIGLEPCGHRHSGRRGRPAAIYDARVVMEAHTVLVPFTQAGSSPGS